MYKLLPVFRQQSTICLFLYVYVFIQAQEKDTLSIEKIIIEKKASQITTGQTGSIKIYAEEVKKIPSILGNTNLLKILELTPGVQPAGDVNSNIYVRGGDPGQNLLLYNDNVIYSPGHLLSFFPLFNADHVSSLELLKSGVSAQYGGYLSSVISVEGTFKNFYYR